MAKGKGKKTPRIGKAPQDSKQPRAGAHPESTEHESPVWHVGRADFEGPFGWGTVNDAEVWRYIHSKLRDFETMSWADIGNTRSHTIPVESLCAAAQRRLIDLGHDDISEVYSLRFRGRERMFGIRDGRVLKILWWDPAHQVCPSTKRHT